MIMNHNEILVEWADKAPNILTEKRKAPSTRKGLNRQLANVTRKYEEYFKGYPVLRMTVTHTHCS